ncbi:MAG: hypothetical protein P4M11_14950 [Candidatus Pacebacteria bacterium]|nr:hypothetical protein [Candidatus Paceibacterota bacterium]
MRGTHDTQLATVVQDIIKEKEREMIVLDGWRKYLREAVANKLPIDQVPQTHLLLAIHSGNVRLCTNRYIIGS